MKIPIEDGGDNKEDVEPTYQADISVMYYIVFCGVSEYFKLTPIEVSVLSFVGSFHRKGLLCYASKKLLARVARTSPPSIFTALKKLKNRGLLQQSFREGRVCLALGQEAIYQLKYVEECIKKRKEETKKISPL